MAQADRVVVTVSDDKTARAWSLATGDPLAVMRGAIGSGPEGAFYAAALSPSGKTVAVAGHTGLSWDGTASIYLFHRISQDPEGSAAVAVVLLVISFTVLLGIGALRWFVTRHERG